MTLRWDVMWINIQRSMTWYPTWHFSLEYENVKCFISWLRVTWRCVYYVLSQFDRCVSWFHCRHASAAHITAPARRYNDHCLPWGDLNEDAENAYFASCCFQSGHRWVRCSICATFSVLLNLLTTGLKWGRTVHVVTWDLSCSRTNKRVGVFSFSANWKLLQKNCI